MAIFGGKKPDDQPNPEVNISDPDASSADSGLAELTAHLSSLQETLQQTESQVAVSKHADERTKSTDERLEQIASQLNEIAQKVGGAPVPAPASESTSAPAEKSTTDAAPAADLGPLLQQVKEGLTSQFEGVANEVTQSQQQLQQHVNSGLSQVYQHLDSKLTEIVNILRPPQPEVQEQKTIGDDADWQVAILGPELTADPSLENYRRHLLEGVITGNEGARTFAGQLLVFRSARTDALPQMLKLLGEAFYTWLPKSTQDHNPMEQALVQWVNDYCYNAGIGNTIEVITPGERFDTQRHTPTNRSGGVEIQVVRGWVVVREGGRVYTKATVDVV